MPQGISCQLQPQRPGAPVLPLKAMSSAVARFEVLAPPQNGIRAPPDVDAPPAALSDGGPDEGAAEGCAETPTRAVVKSRNDVENRIFLFSFPIFFRAIPTVCI